MAKKKKVAVKKAEVKAPVVKKATPLELVATALSRSVVCGSNNADIRAATEDGYKQASERALKALEG